MTSSGATTVLSVRGEAQRTVAPDQATVMATVRAVRDTRAAATTAVTETLAAVTGELAELGGAVFTVATARAPLTWAAHSLSTREEQAHNKDTGEHGPTGRHRCSVVIVVAVRDFGLLNRVSTTLIEREAVDVHRVQWTVDHDNPEWGRVRAEAIEAALLKAQDYAAALGGAVTGVEQVADAGLLDGGDYSGSRRARATSAMMLSGGGDGEDLALDPVPQELSAAIDARVTAVVGPLPSR